MGFSLNNDPINNVRFSHIYLQAAFEFEFISTELSNASIQDENHILCLKTCEYDAK